MQGIRLHHRMISLFIACVYKFTFITYGLVVITTQRTPLLLGFCRHRLHKVEIGFGVDELLDLPDLQASVFVGNDVCDGDGFVDNINPEVGLRLLGEL